MVKVKDKVGRSQGEPGVSKAVECDTFSFSALTLDDRNSIRPVKKLSVGLLVVTI